MTKSNDWEDLNEEIIHCRKCPRLVSWREEVARIKRKAYRDWEYWGKPVPGFGDWNAKIFVVGLAPGAHGSNRTGRMFTGDSAGNFLYRSLFTNDFANQGTSVNRDDGLELKDIFISALCRCAPPDNKPTTTEINNCRPFLLREISLQKNINGFVALGSLAYSNLILIYKQLYNHLIREKFGHGVVVTASPELPFLICSYHPSQQNTQTGRLTETMFDSIWKKARMLLYD